VDQIFEGPKNTDTFRRLARLRTSSLPAIVVGDQLDRDIAPAQNAGFVTIYFPGGFRPKWQAGYEKETPDYRIESFEQVAEIVTQVVLKNTTSHQHQI
jgi:putative hydrolase of the HAD superfamily